MVSPRTRMTHDVIRVTDRNWLDWFRIRTCPKSSDCLVTCWELFETVPPVYLSVYVYLHARMIARIVLKWIMGHGGFMTRHNTNSFTKEL